MTVTYQVDLETCQCSECGITYGVPDNWKRGRREDHRTFYCPNGHAQYLPAKSDVEILKERLADEQRKHANTQFELMMREKETKKLRKRVSNGICPCCHRSFVQMSRHMKTKHPDYVEENNAKTKAETKKQ